MSSTVECKCANCGTTSTFTSNDPCEEIYILYFNDGWDLREPCLCPECNTGLVGAT